MPVRCVVGGCSNVITDKISLHRWPKDEKTRRLWTKFVQKTRADFAGPSQYSSICSEHFTEDDYDPSFLLKEKMGLTGRQKRVVLPGKYPTLKIPKTRSEESTSSSTEISSGDPDSSTSNVRPNVMTASTSRDDASQPKQKKPRLSSERRKRKEEAAAIIEEDEVRRSLELEHTLQLEKQSDLEWKSLTCEKSCQTTKNTEEPRKKTYRRSAGLQVKPKMKTKETQTTDEADKKMYETVAIQCTLLKPVRQQMVTPSPDPSEQSDVESEAMQNKDDDYVPNESDATSTDDDFESEEESKTPWEEDKFIVFKSCLMMLFSVCLQCTGASKAVVRTTVGSLVIIVQKCKNCGWKRTWHSQPYCKGVPAGNLFLSSSILFAGASATKVLRVLQFLRCHTISTRTFFRHQKSIMQPVIVRTWEAAQQRFVAELQEENVPLVLGGDARSDSPGHTAKYGSYSLLELRRQKVLDVVLVQKNEVSSSNAMELEGLKRAVKWLFDSGLMEAVSIECIITDRHLQVAKWIRENLAIHGILHYYDVWHIAKSIKKKLKAIGSKKGCEIINDWQQSIINHVYWTSSSTPSGDPKLMVEKFLSIENHLQNIHEGHHGDVFLQCAHEPLSMEVQRSKKWLEPGTEVCEKLSAMVNQPQLIKGIKQMSPKQQTSSVEAFHSLILHFAPKQFVFSYEGMTCRLLLAAMHYNENGGRAQATDKKGNPAFRLEFPRAKCGGYTIRKTPVKATFGYVDTLLEEIQAFAESHDKVNPEDVNRIGTVPPPLTQGKERPTLEEAVQKHYTRFNTQ